MRSRYDKVWPTIRRQLFLLLATLSIGFFTVTSAYAATYYVATTGSDSNPGTQAAPFKTIAKGSRALAAGDTLLIRGGTYNEQMMGGYGGFVFQNGTPGAYTRYAAYPGEQVIVKPSGGQFVAWFSPTTAYIELSGMVLDGTNVDHNVVKMAGGRGDLYPRHNRLLRNEIKQAPYPWKAVSVLAKGPNEFIGNKIYNSNSYGMYLSGHNGLVEGNIIHDNAGYAIHLFDQNHSVNGWVIRNNIMYNNGGNYRPTYAPWNGNVRPLPAVLLSRGKNEFYNNLVYNNPNGGVSVYGNGDGTLVANNTIYGNGKSGITVSDTINNARIINNISWGNRSAQIADNGRGTVLQNNLTTDPKFVNASAGDFGLQAGSPAIDKGMALAEVKTDFTGKARPEGAAYDIGAFEGAGSRKDAIPAMPGGLPPGGGSGGAPILRGPNGEVCPSGYL